MEQMGRQDAQNQVKNSCRGHREGAVQGWTRQGREGTKWATAEVGTVTLLTR